MYCDTLGNQILYVGDQTTTGLELISTNPFQIPVSRVPPKSYTQQLQVYIIANSETAFCEVSNFITPTFTTYAKLALYVLG